MQGRFGAVYSYANLYQSGSGYADLFIAASVFVVPMTACSVGTVISKLMLMRRRIKRRRADAVTRAVRATSRLTPAARRALLRMLTERLLLRHDQLQCDERKSANDARRYEGYGYLFGVTSKVRTGSHRTNGSFAHPRPQPVMRAAGTAFRRDQWALFDAHRR